MKSLMTFVLAASVAGLPWLNSDGSSAPQERSAGEAALVSLASVYQGLADSILANKRTEKELILGIVGVERDLALEALAAAEKKAPGAAGGELRMAAERIGDFATEGGAVIEPIRNRLLQGGHHHHHHHADAAKPKVSFDLGYVVINTAMKRSALDLAKECAMMAESTGPKPEAIAAIAARFREVAAACMQGR